MYVPLYLVVRLVTHGSDCRTDPRVCPFGVQYLHSYLWTKILGLRSVSSKFWPIRSLELMLEHSESQYFVHMGVKSLCVATTATMDHWPLPRPSQKKYQAQFLDFLQESVLWSRLRWGHFYSIAFFFSLSLGSVLGYGQWSVLRCRRLPTYWTPPTGISLGKFPIPT
jgi:hypothetical protein